MIKKTLAIVLGSLGFLTLFNLIPTHQPLSAAFSVVNDFNAIEWIDLGEEAFYPGELGISEGQSIVVNNKLYVFGGYAQCCIPIRESYVFDPIQNRWTPLADLPLGTTHTGIATDEVDIYLAGGYVENADQSYRLVGHEKVWRYNVALDTYTALPNLPKKASTGQLAYLNGKLHYIGGTTPEIQTEDLPDHFVFDLQAYQANPNTEWLDITATAPLPNPRQHSGIAVVDDKIYYVGGQHFHNNDLVPQDDVHQYDPATNTWTQMADMPALRNHMSNTIVVHEGKIIVIGGQFTHETPRDEVYSFDPTTNTWTQLTSLPRAQFSAIGGIINGELYFGTGDKGYFDNERRRMRKGIINLNNGVSTPTLQLTETPITQLTTTPLPENTALPTVESTASSTTEMTPIPTFTNTSTPTSGVELLIDGSFEATDFNGDKLPDQWQVKSPDSDRLKCNKPNKSFANNGDCAFMFKGSTAKNVKLQQNVDLAAYSFAQGNTLQLYAYINANKADVNGSLRLIIKFSDNTGKVKRGIDFIETTGYQLFSDSVVLPSANITLLRVQAKHKSPDGKVLIDDISLKWSAQPGILPLP